MRRLLALLPLALLTALLPAAAAPAAEVGAHSDNMSYVKNLPYRPTTAARELRHRTSSSGSVAATATRSPARTRTACRSWTSRAPRRRDRRRLRLRRHPGRRPGLPPGGAGPAASSPATRRTPSATARRRATREAAALGFDVLKADGTGKNGTFIVEHHGPARARDGLVRAGSTSGSHNHDRSTRAATTSTTRTPTYHVGAAGDRGLRHPDFATPEPRRRARRCAAPGPRQRSRTTSPSTTRAPRVLGGALPRRDHRHDEPGATRRSSPSFVDPAINVWHQRTRSRYRRAGPHATS